jgi:O-antigen/teichoic acid export membrane protein
MQYAFVFNCFSTALTYLSGIYIAWLLATVADIRDIADWALISSVISMVPILELGIGGALFSTLVGLRGKKILTLYSRVSYFIKISIAIQIVIFIVFIVAVYIIDEQYNEVIYGRSWIYWFILIIPFVVLVNVCEKIHASRNNWTSVKVVDTFLMVCVLVFLYFGFVLNLINICLILWLRFYFTSFVKLIVFSSYLNFLRKRFRDYVFDNIRWNKESLPEIKSYFIMSFVGAFALSSDTFLIAYFYNASDVANYYSAQRIFMPFAMIFGIISPILWFRYARSTLNKNFSPKLKRAFFLTVLSVLFFSAIVGYFIFRYSELIVSKWLPGQIEVSVEMYFGHYLWMVLVSVGAIISPAANALKLHKEMAFSSVLMLVSNLFLTVIGLIHIGPASAIYASVFSTLFTVTLPLLLKIYKSK